MFKKYVFLICTLSVPLILFTIEARLIQPMPSTIQAAKQSNPTQNNEVILFYKPGCPFCPYVDSLFNQLKKQNNGKAEFKKININGNSAYKTKYGFSTVPTVVYIKDGQTIAKHGSNNKKIKLTDMQRHMQSF